MPVTGRSLADWESLTRQGGGSITRPLPNLSGVTRRRVTSRRGRRGRSLQVNELPPAAVTEARRRDGPWQPVDSLQPAVTAAAEAAGGGAGPRPRPPRLRGSLGRRHPVWQAQMGPTPQVAAQVAVGKQPPPIKVSSPHGTDPGHLTDRRAPGRATALAPPRLSTTSPPTLIRARPQTRLQARRCM